jgi:hypothetical protein
MSTVRICDVDTGQIVPAPPVLDEGEPPAVRRPRRLECVPQKTACGPARPLDVQAVREGKGEPPVARPGCAGRAVPREPAQVRAVGRHDEDPADTDAVVVEGDSLAVGRPD